MYHWRLEACVRLFATSFLISQAAEDGFNKIKRSVDGSANEGRTAMRCTAIALDKHVVDTTHDYEGVDRTSVK